MKKTLAILLALALCLGLLAGCSGSSGGGSDAPAAGDGERTSIVLAESSQWWGADCVLLDGTSFGQCLIQEPLVALDDDGMVYGHFFRLRDAMDLSQLRDVVSIAAGNTHFAFVHRDGRVTVLGNGERGQTNTVDWKLFEQPVTEERTF